jgi:rhodanese-related sulfurtransferase
MHAVELSMNDLRIPSQSALEPAFESPELLFARATVRRAQLDLRYAGAVTPPEAWQLMQQGAAQLVDVRTVPEFKFVGHVPDTTNVEWHGRDEAPREVFLHGLRAAAPVDAAVLLICRSGVRSHAAANAAFDAGYARVYNVLEGFEGQINHDRQRGRVNGWRFYGLPWEQD